LTSPNDTPGTPGAPGTGDTSGTPVLAAGCVLWRRSPTTGTLEICLVHRPKYDDWSHPKGKLSPGEDPLAGALREVAEETGYDAVPGAELGTVTYTVGGRPKQVRYWAAEATAGRFTPNKEVDRVLWLPPAAARARLTRAGDRELIDGLPGTAHLA
jgi:8-oxo-dGTP diphosphatase